MEFAEVVRRRRMVRNYTTDAVDPDAVRRILATALRAPSAGFSQGQSFVVITDSADRARMAELCDEPAHRRRGFDPWVSRAPVHIVPCVRERSYRERYAQPDKHADPASWPVPYWWVDGGAALQLLLLAAVDEGLAAGFLAVADREGLRRLLAIPDDVEPLGLVTLGHPAPDRRSGSLRRGRRPWSQMVHEHRWAAVGTRSKVGMGKLAEIDEEGRTMTDENTAAHLAPGDQAPEGAPGAGENLCPDCSGSGVREGNTCQTCEGTGKVIEGVGGA